MELQEFAVEHDCRLIVTGDTKQHHSVQWGDALRILERPGVIAQTVLTKIYRQRIPALREAIEDLSKGRTAEGFDKLDKCGVIQEIADDGGRLAAIAGKQIEAIEAERSSLIVAPTHGECRAIASAVRQAMKAKGLLLGTEHSVTRLERLTLPSLSKVMRSLISQGRSSSFTGSPREVSAMASKRSVLKAASRYFGDLKTLCLYWPLGTVVITGPKVLDFYAGFCAHRATSLKADGKDITDLRLILNGDSNAENERSALNIQ
jgi:AAA domain